MNNFEITLEGKTYELPNRTPKVAKQFDEFNELVGVNDVKTHYKAVAIIESLLGREALNEIFGTTDKEQIGTIDSILVVKQIDDEYLKPIKEYARQKESEDLNTPAMTAINELSRNVANMAEKLK